MLPGRMMYRDLTVIDILKHAADAFPHAEIVSRLPEGTPHRHGYPAAYRRAARLAHALVRLGIEPGDRVATLAWNSFRHFELYYGISGIGAVCHTINPRLFRDQLAYIARHAEDSIVFVDADLVSVAERLSEDCPGIGRFVILASREGMPETNLPGLACYEELIAGEDAEFDWPEVDERAAAALCYSSGTTGSPKGVLYSHRSTVLHAFGLAASCVVPYGIGATIMPVVPMFHVQAWGQAHVAPMTGSGLVLPGRQLDGASIVELIETERVTVAVGVPTIWLGLLAELRRQGARRTPLGHLVTGGAAAPLAMIRELEEDFGINVIQGWGMTETGPVCALGAGGPELPAGGDERLAMKLKQRRLFGVEFRLVDDDGEQVPADGASRGELQCRGHWIADGYFGDDGDDPLTADGWLKTGDVATLASGGLMQISDRTKDLIKSGGEWISSIDLEDQVMAHPGVAEAAAIAVPDRRWQERPAIIAVARDGSGLQPEDIRRHLHGRVASWWVPEEIILVGELPHTATGKISKLRLREMYRNGNLPTG